MNISAKQPPTRVVRNDGHVQVIYIIIYIYIFQFIPMVSKVGFVLIIFLAILVSWLFSLGDFGSILGANIHVSTCLVHLEHS